MAQGSQLGRSGCACARRCVAVTVDGESGELVRVGLPGVTSEVVAFCAGLSGPVRVAYEAGPTGFGLARALRAAGIGCVVAAPGKIERPAQDRVKTDRRDAERLVRLLMVGGLHAVRVPSGEQEALRDLVRAREDVRGDLMRARHRLGKLLLRHDVRYDGQRPRTWTPASPRLARPGRARDRGAQVTLLDYLGAIDALVVRRAALEAAIAELVPASPWAQTVARLRCLRGIDTLVRGRAVRRDRRLRALRRAPASSMSYLGLVPSEDSSGEKRRQGSITKTGSRHARRLLVEAAWHYRRAPRRGKTLEAPPSRPARARARDRLEGPTAPAPHLAPTRRANAASAARSSPSPSPANSPASAGRSPAPTDIPATHHVGQGGGGNHLATTRESIRDRAMSNPSAATLDL